MTLFESADEIPDDAVAEHYERAIPVYRELGTVEDGDDVLDALLVPGTSAKGIRAWYKSTKDPELTDGGDGAGRPYIARADAEDVPEEVQEWDHPTVFSTINYQSVNADDWTPYTWDDGREWAGGKPLPEYSDIRGLALFADVDFDAAAKTRPVDDETRSLVEDALERWTDAYADAAGDSGPVNVLDSVGGTYVMLAPRATAAILSWAHEALNAEDRERVVDELASRWRAFNADVQEDVAEEIPDLTGVFELDGNTNKNRLYKAPLALHKSLPGVVTPIDTEEIRFSFTRVEDVTDELVEDCREWAAEFTRLPESDDETLEAHADSLVETLFPDIYAEVAEDVTGLSPWRRVLRQWLEDDRAARSAAAEISLEDLDIDLDADEITLTDDPDEPFAAAEALNVEAVAESLGIVSDTTHADRDEATRIEVNWRQSDSGDSAIVRRENFTDLADSSGGDAAELVAWTTLGSSNSKPTGWRRDGEQVSQVLDQLRDLGFNIPVYVPARGGTYTADGETKTRSRTPNWALAKVARLLDLAPEEAIDEETEAITVPTLYNRVLAVLDHHDIDHGREPKDVHMDATGNDVVASEREIDVDDYQHADAEAGESAASDDADDEGGDAPEDTDEDSATTWTARYGIHEREFISGSSSPYEVRLPGCEDLVWIEYQKYGQRTAGYAYREEDDEGNVSYDLVINADLELVSRLTYPDQSDRDEEWELCINPTDPREPPKSITVDPSAFNSPRDFREEIKGKSGSMRFSAIKGHETVDALKTLVNAQEAPRRKAYSRIKLIHEGVEQPLLVTPNGTLGPDGWVGEPEHVWGDMAEGDVIDKWELDPDLGEFDQDAAREAAELMPQTRVHERFLPVLGYVFASTFRAPITETSVTPTDKWAHIQGFGDTGAGKSSAGEMLWEFIGMEGELVKAKKTPHSALVTLASTNAVPLLLDEYKPAEWRQHIGDAFHEYMRDASTGSSTTKTWNYPVQKTYHLDTSVALFGEGRFPSDANALARRTIETTLSQRATTPDTPMYKAFKKLATTLADDGEKATLHHALGWWSYALQQVEDKMTLVEEWQDAREWALEEIERRGHDLTEVLDRDMYRQHVQTVTFGVRIWRQFAEDVLDADPEKLPTDEEIGDAIEYITMRKNDENAINQSDRDVLFELAARAAGKLKDGQQEYLRFGEHYDFVHSDVEARPTELRLHLRSVVEELNRYVRDYGLDTDVASKNDYYSWIKEAAEDPDSYCLDVGKVTNGKRMVAVEWEALCEELDVMESDFRPYGTADGEDGGEDSSGGDDDPDGDGGGDGQQQQDTPLEGVEDGETATVTVRVDEPDTDTPDSIATEATAVDATDELRLVVWESSDCDVDLEDGDHYRLTDVGVSDYQGDLELHVQEYTEFAPIAQGVGNTEPADAGSNATLPAEDGSGEEAATDGGGAAAAGDDVPEDAEGLLADAQRLRNLLDQRGIPLDENELVVAATVDRDLMDPERAKAALEHAVTEKGIIMETGDGYTPT